MAGRGEGGAGPGHHAWRGRGVAPAAAAAAISSLAISSLACTRVCWLPDAAARALLLQVGCGADELIDLLMRCCLDSGDRIVDCPPTFTMYVFDADVNDARVVTVPRLEGFRIDVEGIK